MLTDRDIRILFALSLYYVLSRPQIQYLCFPTDKTGRVTRRRLEKLVREKYISRHSADVIYPNSSPAGSVYYPAQRGCEFLAEHTRDDRHLVTPRRCPQPHHIRHWLAVSDTHIKLNEAIADQEHVELAGWINEWDVVNSAEQDPAKRFQLYTLLNENPRLVCVPDAAFMLGTSGFSKVFYLEEDRGTSGVKQVAAKKVRGYVELAEINGHSRHFPTTNVEAFTVLCVAPNDRRRDALRRAFLDKPGAEMWKFSSATELSRSTFLFEPVWYASSGDAAPLVKTRTPMEVVS